MFALANIANIGYNYEMDVTIRKIGEAQYRFLKARAALSGKNIGELVTEAIGLLLSMPQFEKRTSFGDLPSFDLGERNVSKHVDSIVYGVE